MSSRIIMKRMNEAVHFKAANADGNSIDIDGSEEIGGEGKGMRPMELLLAGVAGCGSMDIINILKKQKQKVDDYTVEVIGDRREEVPKLWETIKVVFRIEGDIDRKKLERAVSLSMDKYCSVTKHLERDAEVTYEVELNGEKI